MAKSKTSIQNLQPFVLIVVGLFLFSLDRVGFMNWLRSPISYVFEPISFTAEASSSNALLWTKALTNASSYIKEVNSLKEELVSAKSSEESVALLEEENASLKKQVLLSNTEDQFAMAKVLDSSNEGALRINAGTDDGIEEGDIVLIGNTFIGVIQQADKEGSLVRTLLNKSSHYEVAIISKDQNSDSLSNDMVKATGVASGAVNGIKLENIGINAEVSDGDLVVVRDERVGELLVIGRVVGLVDNPASTSKSGYISPVFDYSNLITVFVKTN